MTPLLPNLREPQALLAHMRSILAFYEPRAVDPTGGCYHFFKDDGTVYDRHTRHLVSSTRFVFNAALSHRWFGTDAAGVEHALAFVRGAHARSDGYAWLIDWSDRGAEILDGTHHCYGLAFVLLAHAHAADVGVPGALEGVGETFDLMERRFWEPAHGLYADEISTDGVLSSYRGQNANMHACEAMLAAYAATGEARYIARALALAEGVVRRQASLTAGLVWEHYHVDWTPDWDYNRHDRTNIFRPWGFQTGHLTEWAKLLLQLDRRLGAAAPVWLLSSARHLFDTAMQRGWDAEHGGLVYGFAPDGSVCDGDKYFWVQAESLAAAAWLAVRTGEETYWRHYDRLWAYAWEHFVDHRYGAWYRVLSPTNAPLSDEKSPAGKTDYHTLGACQDVLLALGVTPGMLTQVCA